MNYEKIKFLNSAIAIKYMEEDLIKTENEIQMLEEEKQNISSNNKLDTKEVMSYVRYFLEHLGELLLGQADPLTKASLFGQLFDIYPTYTELTSGTPKMTSCISLNKDFLVSKEQLAGVLSRRWNTISKSFINTSQTLIFLRIDLKIS